MDDTNSTTHDSNIEYDRYEYDTNDKYHQYCQRNVSWIENNEEYDINNNINDNYEQVIYDVPSLENDENDNDKYYNDVDYKQNEQYNHYDDHDHDENDYDEDENENENDNNNNNDINSTAKDELSLFHTQQSPITPRVLISAMTPTTNDSNNRKGNNNTHRKVMFNTRNIIVHTENFVDTSFVSSDNNDDEKFIVSTVLNENDDDDDENDDNHDVSKYNDTHDYDNNLRQQLESFRIELNQISNPTSSSDTTLLMTPTTITNAPTNSTVRNSTARIASSIDQPMSPSLSSSPLLHQQQQQHHTEQFSQNKLHKSKTSTLIQGPDGNIINLNELFEQARKQQQQQSINRKMYGHTLLTTTPPTTKKTAAIVTASTCPSNTTVRTSSNKNVTMKEDDTSTYTKRDESDISIKDKITTTSNGTSTPSRQYNDSNMNHQLQQQQSSLSNPPTPVQTPADTKSSYNVYPTERNNNNNSSSIHDYYNDNLDTPFRHRNGILHDSEIITNNISTEREHLDIDSNVSSRNRFIREGHNEVVDMRNNNNNNNSNSDEHIVNNSWNPSINDTVHATNDNVISDQRRNTSNSIQNSQFEKIVNDLETLIIHQNNRIEQLEEENKYLRLRVYHNDQQIHPEATTTRSRNMSTPTNTDSRRTSSYHHRRNNISNFRDDKDTIDVDNNNNSSYHGHSIHDSDYFQSTPSIQLLSPPPVSLTSRLSQSDFDRRHEQSRRYVDYECLLNRQSRYDYQPSTYGHSHGHNTLSSPSSSNDNNNHHNNTSNVFSPGTQFVEELSRVVDIQRGHYIPLSIIMDKHYAKVNEQLNRSRDTTMRNNESYYNR